MMYRDYSSKGTTPMTMSVIVESVSAQGLIRDEEGDIIVVI